jgi:hypothetical protein
VYVLQTKIFYDDKSIIKLFRSGYDKPLLKRCAGAITPAWISNIVTVVTLHGLFKEYTDGFWMSKNPSQTKVLGVG